MHALVKITSYQAQSNDELYTEALNLPWNEWITSIDTIYIRTRVRSRYFDNAQYASLKVKDAIVKIEKQIIYKSTKTKCEPMLSKYNLYPKLGGDILPKKKMRIKLSFYIFIQIKINLNSIGEKRWKHSGRSTWHRR